MSEGNVPVSAEEIMAQVRRWANAKKQSNPNFLRCPECGSSKIRVRSIIPAMGGETQVHIDITGDAPALSYESKLGMVPIICDVCGYIRLFDYAAILEFS